jgi:Fic family protein
MKYDPHKPYNQIPLVPPKEEIETPAVLKKAIAAGRALGELKGTGSTIPNQSILINTIVLQEAKSSSEIENILTTNDALFKAFTTQSPQVDAATKEVLRYREALWEAFSILKKRPVITTNLLIKLVQIIKQNQAGIRDAPGTAIANASTGEILYTPPEGEAIIRDKMKNLEDYIHEEDATDPLVKLSVVHYQFEAIHPFFDGNGRTGRILCILFLVYKELLDLPILSLSKAIIENKSDYYRHLRNVTATGAWEPWILYMMGVIEKTAVHTRKKIIAIRELLDKTLDDARKQLPARVYSKELIELLFHQPYTKGQFLVDAGIAERQTAAEYLKELEKTGILKAHKIGRENLYLNVKLYRLLSQ